MSLINEALKKAQRQRHEETGEPATAAALPVSVPAPAAPVDEATPVRRGKTSGANTLLLIGSGAVVLVVLSVVVTVILFNRSPQSAPAATVAAARPAPVTPSAVAATPTVESPPLPLTPPVITPPVVKAPAPAPATPTAVEPAAPASTPAVTPQAGASAASSPTPTPAPAPAAPPTPVAAAPAVSTPALPAPDPAPAPVTPAPVGGPAKPDERIARFVEAIKVTGIRSSGAESRVLMNDRVYRVNDTVERTLGVKLTKVEADQLTFADANGLVYVKGI
jgi:ribosome-associated protein YbcJ (S4-like RNA binding protein)